MKWKTFKHNGVIFYPDYIPHNSKFIYDNKIINLDNLSEEYMTYFVKAKGYEKDDIFKKNFLDSWNKLNNNRYNIENINKCNFNFYIKKIKKLEKPIININIEKYKYVYIDGKKEEIENPLIEPPGIFKGRGDHPLRGTIKIRIYPDDVILNLDEKSPIPSLNKQNIIENHNKWGGIVNENESTWIASWKDPISNTNKYINISSMSNIKKLNDMNKYDKARKLKRMIKSLRKENDENLNNDNIKIRQLSAAVYLIDMLCLRVGNEKDTDNTADTVGCCNLKVKNIRVLNEGRIHLNFLGKDSIEYDRIFKVDRACYNNLKNFIKNKEEDDLIFDEINADKLNNYLNKFMKGLTAKVFRTFRASHLMYKKLIKTNLEDNNNLIEYFKKINKEVAKLCNHRKTDKNDLALETSKKNYIDPRIIYLYSKKYNIDIIKLYSNSLIKKHSWAKDVKLDFKY
jgi:DNA topoisomerase-1